MTDSLSPSEDPARLHDTQICNVHSARFAIMKNFPSCLPLVSECLMKLLSIRRICGNGMSLTTRAKANAVAIGDKGFTGSRRCLA